MKKIRISSYEDREDITKITATKKSSFPINQSKTNNDMMCNNDTISNHEKIEVSSDINSYNSRDLFFADSQFNIETNLESIDESRFNVSEQFLLDAEKNLRPIQGKKVSRLKNKTYSSNDELNFSTMKIFNIHPEKLKQNKGTATKERKDQSCNIELDFKSYLNQVNITKDITSEKKEFSRNDPPLLQSCASMFNKVSDEEISLEMNTLNKRVFNGTRHISPYAQNTTNNGLGIGEILLPGCQIINSELKKSDRELMTNIARTVLSTSSVKMILSPEALLTIEIATSKLTTMYNQTQQSKLLLDMYYYGTLPPIKKIIHSKSTISHALMMILKAQSNRLRSLPAIPKALEVPLWQERCIQSYNPLIENAIAQEPILSITEGTNISSYTVLKKIITKKKKKVEEVFSDPYCNSLWLASTSYLVTLEKWVLIDKHKIIDTNIIRTLIELEKRLSSIDSERGAELFLSIPAWSDKSSLQVKLIALSELLVRILHKLFRSRVTEFGTKLCYIKSTKLQNKLYNIKIKLPRGFTLELNFFNRINCSEKHNLNLVKESKLSSESGLINEWKILESFTSEGYAKLVPLLKPYHRILISIFDHLPIDLKELIKTTNQKNNTDISSLTLDEFSKFSKLEFSLYEIITTAQKIWLSDERLIGTVLGSEVNITYNDLNSIELMFDDPKNLTLFKWAKALTIGENENLFDIDNKNLPIVSQLIYDSITKNLKDLFCSNKMCLAKEEWKRIVTDICIPFMKLFEFLSLWITKFVCDDTENSLSLKNTENFGISEKYDSEHVLLVLQPIFKSVYNDFSVNIDIEDFKGNSIPGSIILWISKAVSYLSNSKMNCDQLIQIVLVFTIIASKDSAMITYKNSGLTWCPRLSDINNKEGFIISDLRKINLNKSKIFIPTKNTPYFPTLTETQEKVDAYFDIVQPQSAMAFQSRIEDRTMAYVQAYGSDIYTFISNSNLWYSKNIFSPTSSKKLNKIRLKKCNSNYKRQKGLYITPRRFNTSKKDMEVLTRTECSDYLNNLAELWKDLETSPQKIQPTENNEFIATHLEGRLPNAISNLLSNESSWGGLSNEGLCNYALLVEMKLRLKAICYRVYHRYVFNNSNTTLKLPKYLKDIVKKTVLHIDWDTSEVLITGFTVPIWILHLPDCQLRSNGVLAIPISEMYWSHIKYTSNFCQWGNLLSTKQENGLWFSDRVLLSYGTIKNLINEMIGIPTYWRNLNIRDHPVKINIAGNLISMIKNSKDMSSQSYFCGLAFIAIEGSEGCKKLLDIIEVRKSYRGFPDIVMFSLNKVFFLEVKSKTDILSMAQIDVLNRLNTAGLPAGTVIIR